MGWDDAHRYGFMASDGSRYGILAALQDAAAKDESRARVIDLLCKPGDLLTYTYDSGNSWVHRIQFIALREGSGPRIQKSACIGGRGACPPESSGGMFRYRQMIEVLADPAHPDYAELREWVEEIDQYPFDPTAFNLSEADSAVGRISRWFDGY